MPGVHPRLVLKAEDINGGYLRIAGAKNRGALR